MAKTARVAHGRGPPATPETTDTADSERQRRYDNRLLRKAGPGDANEFDPALSPIGEVTAGVHLSPDASAVSDGDRDEEGKGGSVFLTINIFVLSNLSVL